MMKQYEPPEAEVILFRPQNVRTASGVVATPWIFN